MTKKSSSASSQPDRLKRTTSVDINNRRWTKAETESMRRIAKRQTSGDDSAMDYSDIPPLTDEQLAIMARSRQRPRKIAVSVRLDPRGIDWLKAKGDGHLTRINDILTNLMEASTRR